MNEFSEKYFKFLENEKVENPCGVIDNLIKNSVVKTSICFPWCDTPNHPALELENWILFARSPKYCIEFVNNCFDNINNTIKKSFCDKGFPDFSIFQNKWLEHSKKNPHLAIKYIKLNGPCQALEDIISQDAQCSFEHAEKICGRFKLGEKSILEDSKITIRYLINILNVKSKNDIPLDIVDKIEKTVSEDPESAYFYSFLTKERFELGEKAIAEDSHHSYLYAKNILRDRFELGEKSISKDTEYSFLYAAAVTAGQLPKKMHEIMELKGFQKV